MKNLGCGGRGPTLHWVSVVSLLASFELVLSLSLPSSSSVSVLPSALILATDDELTIEFENSGKKVFFLHSAQHLRNEILFICLQ